MPHWIDVDSLDLGRRAPIPPPSPLDRLPPTFPVPEPTPPKRWQVVLAVGFSCISLLASFGVHFGHVWDPPRPLGRDEVIGTVVSVAPTHGPAAQYVVSYRVPGQSDDGIVVADAAGVSGGQSVVARYDPGNPSTSGTVVSLSVPRRRLNGPYGAVVFSAVVASGLWSRILLTRRRWRRYQAREATIDYRTDEWTGTSNSR
jgi:hypothetical protein